MLISFVDNLPTGYSFFFIWSNPNHFDFLILLIYSFILVIIVTISLDQSKFFLYLCVCIAIYCWGVRFMKEFFFSILVMMFILWYKKL
jgi:hypothetical protein